MKGRLARRVVQSCAVPGASTEQESLPPRLGSGSRMGVTRMENLGPDGGGRRATES